MEMRRPCPNAKEFLKAQWRPTLVPFSSTLGPSADTIPSVHVMAEFEACSKHTTKRLEVKRTVSILLTSHPRNTWSEPHVSGGKKCVSFRSSCNVSHSVSASSLLALAARQAPPTSGCT